MSGKTLLASLMATCGISAAASAVAAGTPGLSAEDQTTGTAELERLVAAAHEEGLRAGRLAERERFGAVLTGEHVEGRMGLAITMLSTTENTPEQINACLAAVPVAEAPAAPAPAAAAPTAQPQAADPLAARDPIAGATPLVDTGAAAGNTPEAADEAQTTKLWDGALASVGGAAITDGVWGGVFGARAN